MKVTVKTTVTLELDEDEANTAQVALWYAADTGGFGHEQSVKLREMSAALCEPVTYVAEGSDAIIRKMRDEQLAQEKNLTSSKPAR